MLLVEWTIDSAYAIPSRGSINQAADVEGLRGFVASFRAS